MSLSMKWAYAAALLLAVALSPSAAVADTIYGFDNVTTNQVADVATGEAQMKMIVSDASIVGQNRVAFKFTNSGPNLSSITDVYFDDGSLLGIAQIVNDSTLPGLVDFSIGASPGNLPSATNINFVASSGFNSDSNPPAQPNGVNPGETLTIIFNLVGTMTYLDTIAALNQGLLLGPNSNNPSAPLNLRVGIHVQGFAGGGSESFVNGPPTPGGPLPPVPLPAAALAGSVLMGGLSLRRPLRRIRRSA